MKQDLTNKIEFEKVKGKPNFQFSLKELFGLMTSASIGMSSVSFMECLDNYGHNELNQITYSPSTYMIFGWAACATYLINEIHKKGSESTEKNSEKIYY